MKKPFLMIVAIAAVATIPQVDARPPDKASNSTYDPNRMVCSRGRESGSRVLQRRVCMPARDWETLRREQRAQIDRAQTSRVNRTY